MSQNEREITIHEHLIQEFVELTFIHQILITSIILIDRGSKWEFVAHFNFLILIIN